MSQFELKEGHHLLLCIDPGEKFNGVAILEVPEGPKGKEELILGFRPDTDMLANLLEKWAPFKIHVCMEEFILYPDSMRGKNSSAPSMKSSAQKWNRMKTSQSIGVIQHYVKKLGIPLHLCRAVDHKSSVTHSYLKRAGLWGEYNLKDSPHIRDATSIGVYFYRVAGLFNNHQRVITETDLAFLAQ